MSFIETRRNRVYVARPLPTDTVVATYLYGSERGRYILKVQPLAHYQAAIDWAISMADYMAGPIELVPYESEEALHHAHLVAQAQALTYSAKDPEVRREAGELFMSLADWRTIRERRLH